MELIKKVFDWAEQVFTVMALLIFSRAFLQLILSGGANEFDNVQFDGGLIQLSFLAIHALSFGLLVLRWRRAVDVVLRNQLVLAPVAIAALSLFWSDAPDLTLRRSIALIGTTLFGIYFATRYDLKQQLRLLGWTFGIAMIMSILFAVGLPQYGIAGGNHAGAWRGIYAHKNGLGDRMALSSIVFLVLAISAKQYRWLMWIGLSLSIMLVVLSKSITALVNIGLILAIFPLYRLLRWRYAILVPGLLGLVLLSAGLSFWLVENVEALLALVGKDLTLTGRSAIWAAVWEQIMQRPWWGYGYEAFWRGLDGASASVWWMTGAMGIGGFKVPHAHNGILELWLSIGLVGVAVLLLGLWMSLLRAIVWVRWSLRAESFWPLLYLTSFVLTNVAEARFLAYNNIIWVLYISTAFSVAELPQRAPQPQPADATTAYTTAL